MTAWTPEREDQLKKLWATGLSASKIAGRMGRVSRNAVIGKIHRLGLVGRATTTRYNRPPRPRQNGVLPKDVKPTSVRPTKQLLKQLPTEPIPEQPDVPDSLFKWLDWDETACRWPYTKGEDQFYGCKCEKLPGLPYCAGHAARAFKPVEVKDRKVTHHKSPEFA